MGKKIVTKVTTEEATDDAEAAAAAGDAEANAADEVDVIRALTELDGADAIRWQVHRISQPNAGYVMTLSTPELTLDRIASDCGPGQYTVKGIRPNGTYYKSGRVSIAQPSGKVPAPAADLAAATAKGDMMPLLLAMMNNNAAIVTAALTRPDTRRGFPTEALITALPALLIAAKDFMKAPAGKDPTEQLLGAVELVEKLKGDPAPNGSTWVDLVRTAIPAMGDAVKDVIGSRAHAAALPAAATVPAIAAPSSSGDAAAIPPPAAAGNQFLDPAWQRQQVRHLIGKAQLQRDVELYVDVIMDEVPGYVAPELIIEQLNRADWWEILVNFEPAAAPHQPWFDTLRRKLIAAYQEVIGEGATA